MGLDRFPNLFFKALTVSTLFIDCISTLFKIFASTGLVPQHWQECKLVLLVKNPTNTSIQGTRPINLSRIPRRIFERILYQQIRPMPWTKVHDNQGGFRPGYSTLSHAVFGDILSSKAKLNIFLDIKKAYDSVPWIIFLATLRRIACPTAIVNLLHSLMCSPATLFPIVNGVMLTTPIITQRGLFQGSILSPLLFCLFIDELCWKLNSEQIPALFFADDIRIIPRTEQDGQKALDICKSFALTRGLQWSLAKCQTINFHLAVKLGPDILENACQYTYLGFPVTKTGIDWHQHAENLLAKGSSFLTAMADSSLPMGHRLNIFKIFMRPKIEYGLAAALLALDNPKDLAHRLAELNKQSLLWILGGRRTYRSVMQEITGLGSIEWRLSILHAQMAKHLKNIAVNNPLFTVITTNFSQTVAKRHLAKCCHSPLLQEFTTQRRALFRQANRVSLMDTKLSHQWKAFITIKLQQEFQSVKNKKPLNRYIKLDRNAIYCPELDLPLEDSIKAISWRIGTAFVRLKCPIHQQPFTRRHVNCILGLEETKMTATDEGEFYTILDDLLNKHDFPTFVKLFDKITAKISVTAGPEH